LLGLAVLVWWACGGTAATTTSSVPSTITTTVPFTTTTTAPPPPEASWAAAPLGEAEVEPVLIEQWNAAENRASCAALWPQGIAVLAPEALARKANFSGGWAIAWDRPTGPGMRADGTFCEDCGRSSFGVAGAGTTVDESVIRSWPDVIEWADGSYAGYGNEGFGEDQGAGTSAGSSPTKLAFLAVAGQECLYNVWSRVDEEELLDIITRLRFVEGLAGST
jgi:hypothetical protein